jgi:hypothetical protein
MDRAGSSRQGLGGELAMTLPHSMRAGALKVAALEYAQGLYPGAVVDAADLAYCAPFLSELPGALRAHGLQLIGTVVHKLEETT